MAIALPEMLAEGRRAGVRHAFVDYEHLAEPFAAVARDMRMFASS